CSASIPLSQNCADPSWMKKPCAWHSAGFPALDTETRNPRHPTSAATAIPTSSRSYVLRFPGRIRATRQMITSDPITLSHAHVRERVTSAVACAGDMAQGGGAAWAVALAILDRSPPGQRRGSAQRTVLLLPSSSQPTFGTPPRSGASHEQRQLPRERAA